MPTVPGGESHLQRRMAESFGEDPGRYDRSRPRYPEAMVTAIVEAAPGRDLLDVGCGTGIAARQFRAAGCRVLGVEVDARMAEFARSAGVEVEVSPFETWDGAGRAFDAVVAGQTWHWIDPAAGPAAAARVLRPGGRLALFWNVFQPSRPVAEAFNAIHHRVLPEQPLNPWQHTGDSAYTALLTRLADGITASGGFGPPEQWRFDWQHTYTRDEWLDQLPTSGGTSQLPADTLARLLAETGAAVDALGGTLTMRYAAVVLTAQVR